MPLVWQCFDPPPPLSWWEMSKKNYEQNFYPKMIWNGEKMGQITFLTPWPPLTPRQVLRLTQKVRREYEPLESAQLNFGATFCGIFSLWLPCWAQIWILQHINSVFLMRNRIHIRNSQRNHLLSLFLQFGTLSVKWICHKHNMDLSYSGVLFPHHSTLQLVRLNWNDHAHENAIS